MRDIIAPFSALSFRYYPIPGGSAGDGDREITLVKKVFIRISFRFRQKHLNREVQRDALFSGNSANLHDGGQTEMGGTANRRSRYFSWSFD
jgi:hypothetical protein